MSDLTVAARARAPGRQRRPEPTPARHTSRRYRRIEQRGEIHEIHLGTITHPHEHTVDALHHTHQLGTLVPDDESDHLHTPSVPTPCG